MVRLNMRINVQWCWSYVVESATPLWHYKSNVNQNKIQNGWKWYRYNVLIKASDLKYLFSFLNVDFIGFYDGYASSMLPMSHPTLLSYR